MANKKKVIPLPVITLLVCIVLFFIPFPAIAVDIMIALYLIMTIAILLAAIFRKDGIFSSFPVLSLIASIYGLGVYVISARLITVEGAAFDSWIIQAVSAFVAGTGEILHLIVGASLFYVGMTILVVVITRGSMSMSEMTAKFIQETLPERLAAAEKIAGSESIKTKRDLRRKADFLEAVYGAVKFLIGEVKVRRFLIMVILLGGTAIDFFLRGAELIDAAKACVSLSLGSGTIFLIPALLQSFAATCVFNRTLKR